MSRGSTNNTGGNFHFVQITKRGFVERVDEGTEGAIARKIEMGVNIGNTVFERITNRIEGSILKIEKKSSEFGDEYKITIDTSVNGNGEKYVISSKVNANHTRNMLKQLVKINPSIDTEFIYKYEEASNGFKYGSINISIAQHNEESGKNKFVGWKFTNNNQNGMPPVKEYVDEADGKTKKSYLDINSFLEGEIMKVELPSAPEQTPPVSTRGAEAEVGEGEGEGEDDLPF